MNFRKLVILFFVFVKFFIFCQSPSVDPHYELVWSDEFNGTSLDANKWKAYDFRDFGSAGNTNFSIIDHPSISMAHNVEVSNGTLKLHLKKEEVNCTDNQYNNEWGYPIDNLSSSTYCLWQGFTGLPYIYTSAEIRSNKSNGYTTDYGYFEARCRMSTTYGVWNSFWMFRDFGEIGNAGEIDIYETLGHLNEYEIGYNRNRNLLKTNVHLGYCSSTNKQGNGLDESDCDYFGVGDLCPGITNYDVNVCANSPITEWHTYGLELTPNKIIWYIDGIVVRSMDNVGVHTKKWIEFGIVAKKEMLSNTPNLNEIHEVDYFRYYKLQSQLCKDTGDKVECNFNIQYYWNQINSFPYIDKSITIGGSGCSTTVPTNGSYYNNNNGYVLRAHDFIEIKGDFTVPLGAELYMDVNDCYE